MNTYSGRPPTDSDEQVDLHVLLVPSTLWRTDLRFTYNSTCVESVSVGFVRVYPNATLSSLREGIAAQLDCELFPKSYVYLKSIGKCLTWVTPKQEPFLKTRLFLPPLAPCPEIYILDAACLVGVQLHSVQNKNSKHHISTGYPHPYFNHQHPHACTPPYLPPPNNINYIPYINYPQYCHGNSQCHTNTSNAECTGNQSEHTSRLPLHYSKKLKSKTFDIMPNESAAVHVDVDDNPTQSLATQDVHVPKGQHRNGSKTLPAECVRLMSPLPVGQKVMGYPATNTKLGNNRIRYVEGPSFYERNGSNEMMSSNRLSSPQDTESKFTPHYSEEPSARGGAKGGNKEQSGGLVDEINSNVKQSSSPVDNDVHVRLKQPEIVLQRHEQDSPTIIARANALEESIFGPRDKPTSAGDKMSKGSHDGHVTPTTDDYGVRGNEKVTRSIPHDSEQAHTCISSESDKNVDTNNTTTVSSESTSRHSQAPSSVNRPYNVPHLQNQDKKFQNYKQKRRQTLPSKIPHPKTTRSSTKIPRKHSASYPPTVAQVRRSKSRKIYDRKAFFNGSGSQIPIAAISNHSDVTDSTRGTYHGQHSEKPRVGFSTHVPLPPIGKEGERQRKLRCQESPYTSSQFNMMKKNVSKHGSHSHRPTTAEYNEILAKIRKLKLESDQLSVAKVDLSSTLRSFQHTIRTQREDADREWKRMYFQEKKLTTSLEDRIKRTKVEHHQLQSIADQKHTPHFGDAVSPLNSEAPSEQCNIKIQCQRNEQLILELKHELEASRQRLKAEKSAHRNLMEECRTLRRELMEKKIACTRTKRQPNVVSVKT